jgi:hypothetical protein
MREFKFFRGYEINPFVVDWEQMNNHLIQPLTFTGTTYTPTWIVNPGLIQYTPPNYNTLTIPNYNITTTPGTGTYTIPYSGTINTTTGFSLTTSNPNGITYTTTGVGGTLTTNTATYSSSSLKL